MLKLENGNIYLDGVICNNPELLFFTLKDYSEHNCIEVCLEKELV